METLTLSRNQVSELNAECFQGLLSWSPVRDCHFSSFCHERAPLTLKKMVILVHIFPIDTIPHLNAKLKVLNPNSTGLPGQIFHDLFELETLLLSLNQISELNAESFHGLSNLNLLLLNEMMLKFLPGQIFRIYFSLVPYFLITTK